MPALSSVAVVVAEFAARVAPKIRNGHARKIEFGKAHRRSVLGRLRLMIGFIHKNTHPLVACAVVSTTPPGLRVLLISPPLSVRTETKGNAGQQSTRRAQDRESVSQALERVRVAARQRRKEKFTSLLHHFDPAMLRMAFFAIKRDAAPGVDGMTWETYEQDLDHRIEDLHTRVHTGAYRAQPSRRSYIPKEDGSKRPLAVAALEDKIVQRAVAAVLSAVYLEVAKVRQLCIA